MDITNEIINMFNENIDIKSVEDVNKHNVFSKELNDWLFGFDDNDEPTMTDSRRAINIAKIKQMAAEWKMKGDVSSYLKDLEKNFNSLRKTASAEANNRYTQEEAEKNDDYKIAGVYFTLNDKGKPSQPIDENICQHIASSGKILFVDSEIWMYNTNTGSWATDTQDIQTWYMIGKHLPAEISNSIVKRRITDLVKHHPFIQKPFRDMNLHLKSMVCFKDYVMDIELGTVEEHDPEYYFTNCIPHKAPDLDNEENQIAWDSSTTKAWLEDIIPNEDDRLMLACYVAYMLTMETDEKKFLILHGKGNTGKSALLRLIKKIIGDDNYTTISLDELANGKSAFLPKTLYGKLASINGDIPDKALKDNSLIKQITGGDSIHTDKKFSEGFDFFCYARLLFSANSIPLNHNPDSAFYDRMMILNINQRGKHIDDLEEKLDAEKELFLWFCVKNYKQNIIKAVKSGNKFHQKVPESYNSKIAVREYSISCDPVSQFLLDETEPSDSFQIKTKEMFSAFQDWAKEANNIQGMRLGRNKFYKSLKDKGYPKKHTEEGDIYDGLKFKNNSYN